jgi:hypothetical protein
MAICDTEETYAYRLAEYVIEKGRFWGNMPDRCPYCVHLFTEVEKLKSEMEQKSVGVLLIAESALELLEEDYRKWQDVRIVVLQENEGRKKENLCYISKYQSPDTILQSVMDSVEEFSDWRDTEVLTDLDVKLIGMYSPIKRCLQTSFALTLGQVLAKKHKVLYLNFEYYSGLGRLLRREFSADMMDVMYYFRCAKEKLAMRLPSILQSLGGLDYIPPIQSPLSIGEVEGNEWVGLCRELASIGQYEYILLDLDDGMNGLFDLLKQCWKIYTIVREDSFAEAKMNQYEQVLQLNELDEIAEKTVKCRFPVFQRLPSDLEMMTHGELAEYVRSIAEKDIYGN